MAPLTRKISVFSDGNILTEKPVVYDGWYCLHALEGGYTNPVGMPAIRPALDANVPVKMTEEIQWVSFWINENRITKAKWRALYGSTVAVTNNQSWYEKVCRDYINRLDLNALDEFGNPSLPKLMKGIIFGGMFLNARREGNFLVCEPGISAIDAKKPMPSIATIKEKNWYMQAVTSGDKIWNLLGSTVPLLIPYILNDVTHYPIEWFKSWNRDYLPNPLTANP